VGGADLRRDEETVGDKTGIDSQIPHSPRGMVIFPADAGVAERERGGWGLVMAAVFVAALLVGIALVVR
jgi:hypothetical protein